MNELLEMTEARMHVYNILRNIYANEPTMKVLKSLSNGTLKDLSENEDVKEGAEKMADASKEIKNTRDLDELHAEFARLFLMGKMAVPPYESLYKGGKTLMGDAAVAVRKEYLEEGLQVEKLYQEPDDHIATEFEFMFFLCKKTVAALKKSGEKKAGAFLTKQRDFMEAHLGNWTPQFCDKIIDSTNSDFYSGAALLTKGFIEEDSRFLKEAGEK